MLPSQLLQAGLTAYIAGLFAAISPCVVVLIPIMLMKFVSADGAAESAVHPADSTNKPLLADSIQSKSSPNRLAVGDGKQSIEWECDGDACRIVVKPINAADSNGHHISTDASTTPAKANTASSNTTPSIAAFLLGYNICYLVFGLCISSLMSGALQNAVRLGIGSFSLTFAALNYTNRIEATKLPVMNNGLLLGATFAALSSVNPCTIPFLAAMLTLSTQQAIVNIMSFAQGLITPSLVFIFIGRHTLLKLTQLTNIMAYMKTITNLMAGVAGVYFIVTVQFMYSEYEMLLTALFVGLNMYWTFSTVVKHTLASKVVDADSGNANKASTVYRWKGVSQLRLTVFVLMSVIMYISIASLAEHSSASHRELDELLASAVPTQQQPLAAINAIRAVPRVLSADSSHHQVQQLNQLSHLSLRDQAIAVKQLRYQMQQQRKLLALPDGAQAKPLVDELPHRTIRQSAPIKPLVASNLADNEDHEPVLSAVNTAQLQAAAAPHQMEMDCLDFSAITPCHGCKTTINAFFTASMLLSAIVLLSPKKSSIGTHILMLAFSEGIHV